MKHYWQAHSRVARELDRSRDPEGLTNVCYVGASLWFNRFAARWQRRTFMNLLESVGDISGKQVLDVGCGTGRWSRILRDRGAMVTGIDLQSETLNENARRIPGCRFVEMSADSIGFKDRSFDLITTVTTLQHVPHGSQELALSEMRRVLRDSGAAILLENTTDRGIHVFANSIEEWSSKALAAGFRVEHIVPYDFAPIVRGLTSLARGYSRQKLMRQHEMPVEEYVRQSWKRDTGGLMRRTYHSLLHAATIASYPLELVLSIVAPRRGSHHVGILARAA
jgi:ubiquinone/menaquinone biosynthesis C-methylase UbiE